MTRHSRAALCLALFLLCAFCARAADKVTWKPIPQVILQVNGKAPKTWNVYRAEKRDGWILVKLWRRYLLIDEREQAVYDLDPQKLKAKGEELEWSETDKPAKPIEISEWSTRNIGPARRIRFKFGSDGGLLEVQVPQKRDLRPFY
jgi:hypothetical protein